MNAGSAEVIGLEFEFIYQPPVDGLSFNGGYTWLPRARYTEFDQITNSGADVAGAGNCKPIDTDGVPGADDCLVTFAGNRLERAPKHAFVLGASYTQPFFNTGINWFVEGDVQYQGEMFDDEDNLTRWDSWHELDLRAGLQAERWAFLVFVDNVTGNDTFRTGGSGPNFGQIQNIVGIPALGLQNTITGVLQPNFAPLPPKRQVGVRGSVNF